MVFGLWDRGEVDFDISFLPVVAALKKEYVGLESGEEASRQLDPLVFRGSVATKIDGFGQDYGEIRKGCITASEIVALHNAWLMGKLGQFKPTRRQRRLFSYLFERPEKRKHPVTGLEHYVGNICDTVVDYNDPGKLKPKKGFSRAAIINHPKGFICRGLGLWEVEIDGDSRVTHTYIPASGGPVWGPRIGEVKLIRNGLYQPCGLPFDTTWSREEAERIWTDKEYDPNFAKLSVSEFRSCDEGSGVRYVERQYFDDAVGVGVFYLSAIKTPGRVSENIGRLSVRRCA